MGVAKQAAYKIKKAAKGMKTGVQPTKNNGFITSTQTNNRSKSKPKC